MGGYMYGVSVGSVLGVAVEEYSDAESAGLRLVAGHVGKSIRVLVVVRNHYQKKRVLSGLYHTNYAKTDSSMLLQCCQGKMVPESLRGLVLPIT